eukprot:EC720788.1.p1 GENE.EC720788.1~~EC720788.1.p1  ORF type:complete len:126 (+),score=17.79 EC720788.1:98-475(+)
MDQRRLGLFSWKAAEAAAPYVPPQRPGDVPPLKGPNFHKAAPKEGQQDRGLTPFKRLDHGPYMPPGVRAIKEAHASRKLQVSERAWKPTGPTKKQTGPGTWDGTFTRGIPHYTPSDPDRRPDRER